MHKQRRSPLLKQPPTHAQTPVAWHCAPHHEWKASRISHPGFDFPLVPYQCDLQEAREATLAAKKAEHLKDEASLALEVAKEELKACQLVVDEASEAARLREQVNTTIAPNGGMQRISFVGFACRLREDRIRVRSFSLARAQRGVHPPSTTRFGS